MLLVALFDLVKLVFAGFVFAEGLRIKKVAIILILVDDVEGHFEVGILEFDDEVDKYFIFHLSYGKIFSAFPELLGHPVSNNRHIFQVLNVLLYIVHLLSKQPR